MEKKYDQQFQIIFEAIKQLLATDEKPKKKIGYTVKRHDGLDTLCINVPQNVS